MGREVSVPSGCIPGAPVSGLAPVHHQSGRSPLGPDTSSVSPLGRAGWARMRAWQAGGFAAQVAGRPAAAPLCPPALLFVVCAKRQSSAHFGEPSWGGKCRTVRPCPPQVGPPGLVGRAAGVGYSCCLPTILSLLPLVGRLLGRLLRGVISLGRSAGGAHCAGAGWGNTCRCWCYNAPEVL